MNLGDTEWAGSPALLVVHMGTLLRFGLVVGLFVRLGNATFNVVCGGGEGSSDGSKGGDSQDEVWGGSNLGHDYPTPKEIYKCYLGHLVYRDGEDGDTTRNGADSRIKIWGLVAFIRVTSRVSRVLCKRDKINRN